MASPEKIAPLLPETLPEDFGDWDSEGSPVASPGNSDEWEALGIPHSFAKSPKTLDQSGDHDGLLPPTVDRPRVSGSTSSAPTIAKQQKDLGDWDREASSRTSTPAPAPANQNEWDDLESPQSPGKPAKPPRQFVDRDEWEALEVPHLLGKSPTSLGKSADPDAILPPVVQRPTASGSTSGEPIVAQQQNGFSNRDREAPHAPTPATVDHDEWKALQAPKSVGKSTTSLGKSAEPDPILSPVVNKPRVSVSGSSAPASLKPFRTTSALLVDGPPRNTAPTQDGGYTMHEVPIALSRPSTASVAGVRDTPELASTASREADRTLFQSFQAKDEETGEQKPAKKKWMIIAAVSICSILLLLVLVSQLLQHRTKSAAMQSVQPPPALSDTQPETNTPAPSASEPLAENKSSASTQVKPADNQPAIKQNGVDPPQAQKDMMHDQLTAPLQIPQAVKKQVAENGPPPESIGAAGTEGLGGSMNPNISNGQATPIVKPLKPLVISAGVATGLLIQKNPPIYPAIARSARVSGTVVLEATITTTGTIKNLYTVSGPAMLRQAAVDAVRTWRYKPYTLNNEPVEVQATINVIFNLGP